MLRHDYDYLFLFCFWLLMLNHCHGFVFLDAPAWTTTTTTTTRSLLGGQGKYYYNSHHPTLAVVLHAKSICTFDAEDFAEEWPYLPKDMNRLDNTQDENFYTTPRLVTHIDDGAIQALTEYYQQEFTQYLLSSHDNETSSSLDILDLCSSWISHFPLENENNDIIKYGRVIGLGMNQEELEANPQLTERVVQDLNQQPTLDFLEDNSMDMVCMTVSVDYLTRPLPVFQEIYRVLKPNGGTCLISFSNRCFPTKAIAMWLQADDIDRLSIVASYFHYASNKWTSLEALDLKTQLETPPRPSAKDVFSNPAVGLAWMNSAAAVAKNNQGDPMFVVKAVK